MSAAPRCRLQSIPFVLLIASLAACSDSPGAPGGPTSPPPLPVLQYSPAELDIVEIAAGFSTPIHLTAPAGDDRLFVVERFGRIRIIDDGQVLETPYLDVSEKIGTGGSERGLLSMAFHPSFAQNGYIYVMYTAPNGAVTVERYTAASATANVANPASAKTIISIPHPDLTHNGGLVTFGPDGMLYVSVGDGGGRGDPKGNAQNLGSLLGKMLRLNVDAGDPYAVPPDNPFVGRSDARPEIWAYGLRNPWRYTFSGDGAAARLLIADVGMDSWEEVNAVAANAAGLNYGWNITEGAHCLGRATCVISGITFPVLEYGHSAPCTSLTGGYVYAGAAHPEHTGRYFFADYCLGWLRSVKVNGTTVSEPLQWSTAIGRVTSFGRDGQGELYILRANGTIARLGAAS